MGQRAGGGHISFENINRVIVPIQLFSNTINFLQKWGKEDKEAHCLWVGIQNNDEFNVKEAWFPKQHGCSFLFDVSGDELDRINRELFKKNLRVIAQIHSHMGSAFHSSIDDEYPIATTLGAFSIVFPNYGYIYGFLDCAIFRLNKEGWNELSEIEIKSLFSLREEGNYV